MSRQLTLTDREFQFAVRLRLNLPPDDFTTASTQCICGFTLHNDPYHALCCLKISAIERHNQVKQLFAQCASKLFITCSREPAGWCSSDNKRPDLLCSFTSLTNRHSLTLQLFIRLQNPTCAKQLTMAECVVKLNITRLKNTKRLHFPIQHFSFVRLFSQPLVNGANRLLN